MLEVKKITQEMTYRLRHTVLRPHQTIEDCKYDTDYEPGALHVGAFSHGRLISIASFCIEKNPDFSIEMQYRLRGMATLEEFRKLGAGRLIIAYAEDLVKAQGFDLIWCNARTSVQEYYSRVGFNIHGDVFDYPPIGPHIVMFKKLS
ncbi:GNAT family N-acetyltransferase [Bacillus sp. DTU_2020_1000418_1_SI_GHA_SEK_038]|uniref:GNAT family N-acetyltransferase n=1 Tax=Bacillus sp. DTU_2020_1000418_1_SI_GHA_SEK_038 TaxID=3077585 RepID=UPI0028E2829F|nr:GNAT family N-acetyltransferase [Bacillus sp. DTU_2020_1000418_1_SI_GHA_SEK_038]WNS76207.1 GNAT family N-acetyltransferase [Bacillus sp. DTU_2020_1000418_1_SI_GHA_SEK_038]